MISAGIANEGKVKVAEDNTAAALGSGTLPVFATPAMILLIEKTAAESVSPMLGEGESTVGTRLDIRHSAPSVIGSEIFCRTELVEVDRSRLVFSVKVWDSAGEIGSGTHERFLVGNEKFMAKASSRYDE